jgi:2-alkyl-3-oxoalkanoate reductase
MQNVLVLGADGYVGQELVSALASSGLGKPILGVRKPSSGTDFEQRPVDPGAAPSVLAAMQQVSVVVNCVAGNAAVIAASAGALAAAVRSSPSPPRIIHLSTIAVYGSTEGLVDESASLQGDQGPYSAARVAAEATLSACPRLVMLRPGLLFGPRSEQWTIRIAQLLMARRLGDLGAAGDGYCNLVHVGDVVQGILQSLRDSRTDGRVFNLGLANPPTWNEFLVKFGIALRATPVRRISPRRLRIEGKFAAPPLKLLEMLGRAARMESRRLPQAITPSLLRTMRQEIKLDTRRAQTELGMRWKDVASMIEEAASSQIVNDAQRSRDLPVQN